MKLINLFNQWESPAPAPINNQLFNLRLSAEDTAKIHALAAIYPNQSAESILSDLLAATLQDVREKLKNTNSHPIKHH